MKTNNLIIYVPIFIIILIFGRFINVHSEPAFPKGAPLYFYTAMKNTIADHDEAEKKTALPQTEVTHGSMTSEKQILSNGFSETFSLSQNYPNPFNPVTTIRYRIPTDGFVILKVYDSIGQEVMTLVNEPQTAGTYEAIFNGQQVASGVYFYKLKTKDITYIRRMMLIK